VVVEANLFARAVRVIQSYANQIGTCEAGFGEGAGQRWYCCVVCVVGWQPCLLFPDVMDTEWILRS
jgi:hypothetical protein